MEKKPRSKKGSIRADRQQAERHVTAIAQSNVGSPEKGFQGKGTEKSIKEQSPNKNKKSGVLQVSILLTKTGERTSDGERKVRQTSMISSDKWGKQREHKLGGVGVEGKNATLVRTKINISKKKKKKKMSQNTKKKSRSRVEKSQQRSTSPIGCGCLGCECKRNEQTVATKTNLVQGQGGRGQKRRGIKTSNGRIIYLRNVHEKLWVKVGTTVRKSKGYNREKGGTKRARIMEKKR